MDAIETRFAEFSNAFDLLEWVGLAFLLLIVSETFWDFLTGRRARYKETAANYAIALVSFLLDRTVYGLVFVVTLFAASAFAPFSIPVTWWSWLLALLAADFTYYWMHRFEHEIRILWAHHSVHHSSPEFNLTTALRLSWVERLIEWLFFVPMILIGFDPLQTVVAIAAGLLYQTWIHTEKIGKLGWLDGILNTPSAHRVHHACNGRYLDKNYGGVLIVWDRMFGTYQREEEPVVYGITEPIKTSNPLTINFHEYGRILADIRRAKGWRAALGYLFGRPGWKPDEKS